MDESDGIMNTVTPKFLIITLKIMIAVCITMVGAGFTARCIDINAMSHIYLLTAAIGILILIPVVMLFLIGWEYYRKKNYLMTAWVASICFIIAVGTTILFLIKKM